jgi:FtsZ-interacting cell division protein ZipA
MSDLQISLVVIGAVVVAAVYVYNRVQEGRFRRRMRQAFGDTPEDVLLTEERAPALHDGRVEPQLDAAPRAELPVEDERPPEESGEISRDAARAPAGREGSPDADRFDTALDYVAEIDSELPIRDPVIGELQTKITACGRPGRMAGWNPETGHWDELVRGAGARYTRLRIALQLVNRAGTANAAQLAMFCDAVTGCAERIPARAACPDAQAALATARELDAFCARVDVAIGVNIIAEDGKAFRGTRIRGLAEAAGFKLEPEGVFHYRDEARRTLFTLDNHQPAPFLPEQVKSLVTTGITLMLDVPRVAGGVRAIEHMIELARGLAEALGGRIVDDNRIALTEPGVARIKEQVRAIQDEMEAHGIPAGGERALRLFS